MEWSSAAARTVHWIQAIAINQFCYEQEKMHQKPLGCWEGKFLHSAKQKKNPLFLVIQQLLKLSELAELPLNHVSLLWISFAANVLIKGFSENATEAIGINWLSFKQRCKGLIYSIAIPCFQGTLKEERELKLLLLLLSGLAGSFSLATSEILFLNPKKITLWYF